MRIALAASFLFAATAALAQTATPGHDMPGHGAAPGSAVTAAAATAFAEANAKMHEAMAIDYSVDPDIAFARGMIAHHQGAVDMANVVLQFGEDEELAAFARKVIADQSAEIAWLREWLAKRGEE